VAEKIQRTFQGRSTKEIYDRLLVKLQDVASRYSLKVDAEPGQHRGRVHRPGADVKFRIDGERLDVDLDFSFIVPGAIRTRVKDELSQRLDKLFDDSTVA